MSEPPASASRVVGLQTCAAMPGLCVAGDGTQGLVHAGRSTLRAPAQFEVYPLV